MDDDIKSEQLMKWKQTLEKISFNTNPSRLWQLIRGLNNQYCDNTTTHEAILTHNNNNTIPTDQQQAEIINKHHSNISRLLKRQQDRQILRRLHTITLDRNAHFFTSIVTDKAIKTSKNSRSTGPDGISYLHLEQLGPQAIRALTNIFNHSLDNSIIPSI